MEETEQTVTEVTRRGIADALIIEGVAWYGDLNEVDFLSRLYDLTKLRSNVCPIGEVLRGRLGRVYDVAALERLRSRIG